MDEAFAAGGALVAIGAAAEQSGLPIKTIRYYEEIGLVCPARSANGYRAFSPSDVQKLGFLGRARSLGFSVEECRVLLSLWEDRSRASADVKALAHEHLSDIERRIAELEILRDALGDLVRLCHGDDRPDCPILDNLAGTPPSRAGA